MNTPRMGVNWAKWLHYLLLQQINKKPLFNFCKYIFANEKKIQFVFDFAHKMQQLNNSKV